MKKIDARATAFGCNQKHEQTQLQRQVGIQITKLIILPLTGYSKQKEFHHPDTQTRHTTITARAYLYAPYALRFLPTQQQNTSLGRKRSTPQQHAMSVTANKPAKKKILQFDPSLYNIEVDYGIIEVCKVDIHVTPNQPGKH